VPDFHPFGATIPAEASRVVLGLLLIFFALYARRGVAGFLQRARGRRLGV
jgi:ABC-type branched-subunit amino acid transport system permease subunit